MSARRSALSALALATLAGCAPDLPQPWEIEDVRLLGARVEVEGDPERPRPRLDEAFTIRQYIAVPSPVAVPRYDVAATMCLSFRAPGGDLTCIGEQPLAPTVTTLGEGELTFGPLRLDLAAVNAGIAELLRSEGAPVSLGAAELTALAAEAGVDRIAVFGAVCAGGRAERVPDTSPRNHDPSALFRCVADDGAALEAESFTLSVLLDLGRSFDANRNPRFACDPAAPSPCVDGIAAPGEPRVPGPIVLGLPATKGAVRELVAWPELDPAQPPPWEGCASDPRLPKVRGGSGKHQIRLRFDPSDREPYQVEIRENGELTLQSERESLVVAHALSAGGGKLSRYFSTLRSELADDEVETTLNYTPPRGLKDDDDDAVIPPTGRLVRFYFLLRDQRGGVDATTRVLCLVPGA